MTTTSPYIRITLSFVREKSETDLYEPAERYDHTFVVSDEDRYDTIIDKFQNMLEAMGYVFGKPISEVLEESIDRDSSDSVVKF